MKFRNIKPSQSGSAALAGGAVSESQKKASSGGTTSASSTSKVRKMKAFTDDNNSMDTKIIDEGSMIKIVFVVRLVHEFNINNGRVRLNSILPFTTKLW